MSKVWAGLGQRDISDPYRLSIREQGSGRTAPSWPIVGGMGRVASREEDMSLHEAVTALRLPDGTLRLSIGLCEYGRPLVAQPRRGGRQFPEVGGTEKTWGLHNMSSFWKPGLLVELKALEKAPEATKPVPSQDEFFSPRQLDRAEQTCCRSGGGALLQFYSTAPEARALLSHSISYPMGHNSEVKLRVQR
ncbi:unnamed protein product [Protopolystoma xenopodis]|uniref:Uncharacterized protein n=1 Tax=Protopolystoma xenopodis TaxID=117903 RepID=A0A3S5BHP9_9PLAT|nr:unnamed protein product [Protopolystoma xenopodis]